MPVPGIDLAPQNSVIDLLAIASDTELTVGGTNVVYTKYFPMPRNADIGLLAKIGSVGTINVKVELEQGNTVPTNEAADSSGLWGVGQILSAGLVAAGTYPLAITPPVTKFARLKLTGVGSNDAATKFTVLQIAVAKKSQ